jgi:hypothetical protein
VGTVFVIGHGGSNRGVLTLFHDGSRVAQYRIGRWGDTVRFASTAGDVGRWHVHLDIPKGDQPCGADDEFTVTAAPDTATATTVAPAAEGRSPAPTAVLLVLAGLFGFLLPFRRRRTDEAGSATSRERRGPPVVPPRTDARRPGFTRGRSSPT